MHATVIRSERYRWYNRGYWPVIRDWLRVIGLIQLGILLMVAFFGVLALTFVVLWGVHPIVAVSVTIGAVFALPWL